MRARDLQEDYPAVDVTAPAVEAARAIGAERRPAVVVLRDGRPHTVLPGSQVVSFLIPAYLREDPSLVRVYDEKAAEELAGRLVDKSVGDLLPESDNRTAPPVVGADATLIECAALMATLRTPLLVVADDDGRMTGAITGSSILETLLG